MTGGTRTVAAGTSLFALSRTFFATTQAFLFVGKDFCSWDSFDLHVAVVDVPLANGRYARVDAPVGLVHANFEIRASPIAIRRRPLFPVCATAIPKDLEASTIIPLPKYTKLPSHPLPLLHPSRSTSSFASRPTRSQRNRLTFAEDQRCDRSHRPLRIMSLRDGASPRLASRSPVAHATGQYYLPNLGYIVIRQTGFKRIPVSLSQPDTSRTSSPRVARPERERHPASGRNRPHACRCRGSAKFWLRPDWAFPNPKPD